MKLRVLFFAVVLVVLLTGATFWVYARLLEAVGVEGVPRPAAAAEPRTALLLQSADSQKYLAHLPGANPDAYVWKIAGWTQRLQKRGWTVQKVDEAGLQKALEAPAVPPLVVAPAAAALADETVAAVAGAVERGTGLLLSWQYGLRKPDGSWRGWAPLEQLVQLRPIETKTPPAADAMRYVAMHGGTALSVGLPAGARLEFTVFDPPLLASSPLTVADYVGWDMLPIGRPPAKLLSPTAAARASLGAGRVVWTNFGPDAACGDGPTVPWTDVLLDNALDWLTGRPRVALETWPHRARMAMMVGLDAEHKFPEAGWVARRFAQARVPLTTFAVGFLAADNPKVLADLARVGEIASHTWDHKPLADQDLAGQTSELAQSKAVLEKLSGQTVIGIRPPEERANAATWQAMRRTGYEYLVGDGTKDRAEPWFQEVDGTKLLIVPRVPNDDYEYVKRRTLASPREGWAQMRADVHALYRLGGLYFFDFHTHYAADPVIHGGLRLLLAPRKRADVWMTTGRELNAWWRARAGASVTLTPVDATSWEVSLASAAAAPSLGASMFLPHGVQAADVAALAGSAPTQVLVRGSEPRLRLEWATLMPGETRRVRITVR